MYDYWKSVHFLAWENACAILRIKGRAQMAITILAAYFVTFALLMVGSGDAARDEMAANLARALFSLLIFAPVYVWSFLRAPAEMHAALLKRDVTRTMAREYVQEIRAFKVQAGQLMEAIDLRKDITAIEVVFDEWKGRVVSYLGDHLSTFTFIFEDMTVGGLDDLLQAPKGFDRRVLGNEDTHKRLRDAISKRLYNLQRIEDHIIPMTVSGAIKS